MLRRNLIVCLLATLGMVNFGNASAVTLTVQTDNVGPVAQGGSVNASILVSGLGAGSAPSLGTYDLDLSYDSTRFAFNSATFGDPVLGLQLDLFADIFGPIGLNGAFDTGTAVNVFEVSIDDPLDLDTLQADAFTLVTVTFDVLFNGGLGLFDLSVNGLGDSGGVSIDDPTLVGAEVSVIPVPAAVWLFGSALLGLIGIARRRQTAR